METLLNNSDDPESVIPDSNVPDSFFSGYLIFVVSCGDSNREYIYFFVVQIKIWHLGSQQKDLWHFGKL